jgi:nucleotidyltransferase substrate binding protein (TIGR01987 family)
MESILLYTSKCIVYLTWLLFMTTNIIFEDLNLDPLLQARERLASAIKIAKSDLEKTGAIKCFEYCYELSWKLMKKILLKKGIEANSPRDTFREAARNNLIEDPEIWFDFILKRNLTSHTYDEKLADDIFRFLPIFLKELDSFIQNTRSVKF